MRAFFFSPTLTDTHSRTHTHTHTHTRESGGSHGPTNGHPKVRFTFDDALEEDFSPYLGAFGIFICTARRVYLNSAPDTALCLVMMTHWLNRGAGLGRPA